MWIWFVSFRRRVQNKRAGKRYESVLLVHLSKLIHVKSSWSQIKKKLHKINRNKNRSLATYLSRIEMKPLVTIQRCLIWLCIHPAEEAASIRQKRAYVTFTVVVLAGQLFLIVTSLAFCWEFFSIDLERCMLAFMAMAGTLGSVYVMINAIIRMRHKTAAVFEDLTMIYETSKCLACIMFH